MGPQAEEELTDLEAEGEPTSEDESSGPEDEAVSSRATRAVRFRRGDFIMLVSLLLMKFYFYTTLLVTPLYS